MLQPEIDRCTCMVDHIQHNIPIDGAIMLATLLQLPDANRDTMPTTYFLPMVTAIYAFLWKRFHSLVSVAVDMFLLLGTTRMCTQT